MNRKAGGAQSPHAFKRPLLTRRGIQSRRSAVLARRKPEAGYFGLPGECGHGRPGGIMTGRGFARASARDRYDCLSLRRAYFHRGQTPRRLIGSPGFSGGNSLCVSSSKKCSCDFEHAIVKCPPSGLKSKALLRDAPWPQPSSTSSRRRNPPNLYGAIPKRASQQLSSRAEFEITKTRCRPLELP